MGLFLAFWHWLWEFLTQNGVGQNISGDAIVLLIIAYPFHRFMSWWKGHVARAAAHEVHSRLFSAEQKVERFFEDFD